MFTYYARVLRVVDGDTFDAQVDLGFRMYTKMRFRLANIDTPETWRPSCDAEKAHGLKATEYLKNLIEGQLIIVAPVKPGIYDRWTTHAFVIEAGEQGTKVGRSVADMLKENGFEKKVDYNEPCCTVDEPFCTGCEKAPEEPAPVEAEVVVPTPEPKEGE